jgi:hypothetical protein
MAKNKNKGGSWQDFKIGKSFSARDMQRAQKAGMAANDVLRIAASAPSVKNSANKALSSLNSIYTNTERTVMPNSKSGNVTQMKSGINMFLPNQGAKKILTWNGLNADGSANALTINKQGSSPFSIYSNKQKDGTPYGQWTTSKSVQKRMGGGSDGVGGGDATAPSSPLSIGGSSGGDSSFSNSSSSSTDYGTPFAGVDSAIGDSVTSFRRKKSKAKMSGLTSKGTSQFKIGGQSNKSSGLNLGIM